MVSSNKASFNLRETSPLPRNILHTCEVKAYGYTGQRTSQKVVLILTDYRSRLLMFTDSKVSTGYLTYPVDVRDTAKSRIGYKDNRHLHYLAESIFVNVGGSYRNAKESSPLMSGVSVGGVIVLRVRESRIHGEGHQLVGSPRRLTGTGSTYEYR